MNSLRPLRRLMRHGTLPQLAAFVAVVRLGSVTRAAEGLFMAQPTVSGHLAKLSEAVGHPLLENRDRKLRPTVAGQVLYDAAVEVFARLQEAEALLASPDALASLGVVAAASQAPVPATMAASQAPAALSAGPAALRAQVPTCDPLPAGVELAAQDHAILPRGLQDEEIRPCLPAPLPTSPASPSSMPGGVPAGLHLSLQR